MLDRLLAYAHEKREAIMMAQHLLPIVPVLVSMLISLAEENDKLNDRVSRLEAALAESQEATNEE